MAEADRERWNRRYGERLAERDYGWKPSGWLLEIEGRLQAPFAGARVLDLACGGGRNSVWLAEHGWTVESWDVSDVGLAILSRELSERAASGLPLAVEPRQVDLDAVTLPSERYDLILNVMFLDRRLWPAMAVALRPGGLLAFETFVNLPDGRRSEVSPAHLLDPGELQTAFEALGLTTVSYDEAGPRGTARLLAAVSPQSPDSRHQLS